MTSLRRPPYAQSSALHDVFAALKKESLKMAEREKSEQQKKSEEESVHTWAHLQSALKADIDDINKRFDALDVKLKEILLRLPPRRVV